MKDPLRPEFMTPMKRIFKRWEGRWGHKPAAWEQNDDGLRQVGKRRVPTLSMTVMIHPRCAHLLRGGRSLGALHAAQEHEFAVLPGVWVDLRAWSCRQNVASRWLV